MRPAFLCRSIQRWHLIVLTRQLLTVYRSGIPILAGLDVVMQQTAHPRLKQVVRSVRQSVEGGESLSDAMAAYPDVFGEFYRSAVMAGEASGALEGVLTELIRFLEEQDKTAREIRSALRYPVFVAFSLAVAVVVIVTFVFPSLQPLFNRFGDNLPLPTRVLLFSNELVRVHSVALGVGGVALIAALAALRRTDWFRRRWDHWILDLPMIGPIAVGIATVRLATTLSLLLKSGLPLLPALEVTGRVVRNRRIAAEIERVRHAVAGGSRLGTAFAASRTLPPLLVQMAAVGEQAGRLDELFHNVADHFIVEVRTRMSRLIGWLEPVLTALLGAFILFLALSIFLPYWSMLKGFGR